MDSNKFLGKNINDITIEDLSEFFSVEQEESSTIEFKSGEVALEKLYPEISAFLNTNGGILIIGAPRKIAGNKKEIYKGDLIPSKNIKSSFMLSQKISNYIVPSALNISIKDLDFKDGKIFILDIPQSKYPPHQNSIDGIYYIRLGTETVKAPHGLIQAMFNKRQFPNLHIELCLSKDDNNETHLDMFLTNESIITAVKGGYIINIYGVLDFKVIKIKPRKITNKDIHINFVDYEDTYMEEDYHFSFQGRFETLNKGLSLTRNFIVDTIDTNFLVEIVTWAKDTELKYFLWIIDSKNFKPIHKSNEPIDDINSLFKKYKIEMDI